jgi:FAD/FMN-containing dehydrogenase
MDQIRTLDGNSVQLLPDRLQALQRSLSGDVVLRTSPGYDQLRTVWNAAIDRRPAMIVRCFDAQDVRTMVRFAGEHELLLAIRGGGHSIAGHGTCDDGIVLDLSRMRTVRVDPSTQTAIVDPGCMLADVDRATLSFGLATPLGINSTTGVAGLTLGGGFGWLSRKHGLTIDNLVSANVVTASGNLVRTSAAEHDALFWAIRGGGGNFGVVTSFEFALHPMPPEVLTGFIVYPLDDARGVLRHYRAFMDDAPDEVSAWVIMRKAPPLPFIPRKWHNRDVCIIACFFAGSAAEGEQRFAPLRTHGSPVADHFTTTSYAAWQQTFDPLLAPRAFNYWKSHDFTSLADGLLDRLFEYAHELPSSECEIMLCAVGGVASRVPVNATAYAPRPTRFIMNAHARWQRRNDVDACVDWAREVHQAAAPWAAGSAHINFLTGEEADRIPSAYGSNYPRLLDVKQQYDAKNLFRVNQNIAPPPLRAPLEPLY